VSADDVTSHKNFHHKIRLQDRPAFRHGFFADEALGIGQSEWKGMKFWERTTYVVDPKGIIRAVYEKVNPRGTRKCCSTTFADCKQSSLSAARVQNADPRRFAQLPAARKGKESCYFAEGLAVRPTRSGRKRVLANPSAMTAVGCDRGALSDRDILDAGEQVAHQSRKGVALRCQRDHLFGKLSPKTCHDRSALKRAPRALTRKDFFFEAKLVVLRR